MTPGNPQSNLRASPRTTQRPSALCFLGPKPGESCHSLGTEPRTGQPPTAAPASAPSVTHSPRHTLTLTHTKTSCPCKETTSGQQHTEGRGKHRVSQFTLVTQTTHKAGDAEMADGSVPSPELRGFCGLELCQLRTCGRRECRPRICLNEPRAHRLRRGGTAAAPRGREPGGQRAVCLLTPLGTDSWQVRMLCESGTQRPSLTACGWRPAATLLFIC